MQTDFPVNFLSQHAYLLCVMVHLRVRHLLHCATGKPAKLQKRRPRQSLENKVLDLFPTEPVTFRPWLIFRQYQLVFRCVIRLLLTVNLTTSFHDSPEKTRSIVNLFINNHIELQSGEQYTTHNAECQWALRKNKYRQTNLTQYNVGFCSGGSTGAPTLEGAPAYYLANFSENCMKMKKFWARMGACPSRSRFDPPLFCTLVSPIL